MTFPIRAITLVLDDTVWPFAPIGARIEQVLDALKTLDQPLGYFFEDDLEPGPLYLAALEAVRRATEPFAAKVGHFAAYGDHRMQPPGPEVGFRPLGHHWAFGLRRDAWRRRCA